MLRSRAFQLLRRVQTNKRVHNARGSIHRACIPRLDDNVDLVHDGRSLEELDVKRERRSASSDHEINVLRGYRKIPPPIFPADWTNLAEDGSETLEVLTVHVGVDGSVALVRLVSLTSFTLYASNAVIRSRYSLGVLRSSRKVHFPAQVQRWIGSRSH